MDYRNMGPRIGFRIVSITAAICLIVALDAEPAVAGGPIITGEGTLIENRPPGDLFGSSGLFLSLRASVQHPSGAAGFSGPPAGATAEASDNNFPFANPVTLSELEAFPSELYFIELLPITPADFATINGRYRYRVTDVNGDTDTLLGHNLNRMEVIPLPTNLAVSNQTTAPIFTFTDPDPSPNVAGLLRVYHVWIINDLLQGVAKFPPPGGSPTPAIQIPPGVMCPCRKYYLRAESVDADTADAAAENLATQYLEFTPTDVAPNGDMTRDCRTDGRDIQPFVTALLAGSTAALDCCSADYNDGHTIDAGDVPGFVGSLLGS